jgi:hypothetical protein
MSFVHVTSTRGHGLPDYEKVVSALGPEPVAGRISHSVGESDGSLCIVDVWQDQAAADRFAAERLFPAFQSAGVSPQPSTTIIAFQAADRG